MPPKKAVESPKEAVECILRHGKYNNIIQWRNAMETSICGVYGVSGQFLITNERYTPPMPREEDYVPVNPPLLEGEAPYPPVTAASILKLRDHCLEGRRRAMVKQREDERNIYALMWGKMSIASQNKVSEVEGYRLVNINLDSVRLWEFIRRTHLTSIFGGGEIMEDVNRMEQSSNRVSVKI